MTTKSPEPGNVPERDFHQVRQVAESFGSDAERYDRTRPRYPEALVERVVAASPGRAVLDVGCGTGIAARQFQAAGCTVLGVDPDPRMVEWARKTGVEAEVSAFEDWDSAGREFDAVVAGQTWHWLDPAASAAKAAALLRPGGRLAAFWNGDHAPAELVQAFAAVYQELAPNSLAARLWQPGAAEGYTRLGDLAAGGIAQAGAFGAPERWQFDWDLTYTRSEWLDQVPTHGDHSQFPPDVLRAVLAGVGTVIDAAGGSFTMHYRTVAVAAARR